MVLRKFYAALLLVTRPEIENPHGTFVLLACVDPKCTHGVLVLASDYISASIRAHTDLQAAETYSVLNQPIESVSQKF